MAHIWVVNQPNNIVQAKGKNRRKYDEATNRKKKSVMLFTKWLQSVECINKNGRKNNSQYAVRQRWCCECKIEKQRNKNRQLILTYFKIMQTIHKLDNKIPTAIESAALENYLSFRSSQSIAVGRCERDDALSISDEKINSPWNFSTEFDFFRAVRGCVFCFLSQTRVNQATADRAWSHVQKLRWCVQHIYVTIFMCVWLHVSARYFNLFFPAICN